MVVNPFFELISILISLIIILYCGRIKTINSIHNKVFVVLTYVNLITALTDILTDIANYLRISTLPLVIGSDVYFVSHILIIPLLSLYIIFSVQSWKDFSIRAWVMLYLPVVLALGLMVYNKWSGFIYYYEGYIYRRGEGMYLLYAIVAFYMIVALVILFKYKKQFSSSKRMTIMLSLVGTVVSVFIQYISYETRIETFAISFCLLAMFLTVEDPHIEKDYETNLLNRIAFDNLLNLSYISGSSSVILVIAINDFEDYIRECEKGTITMGSQVGSFLETLSPDIQVFRYNKDVFIVHTLNIEEEFVFNIIRRIQERFKEPWQVSDLNKTYSIKMCRLNLPTDATEAHRVNAIIDYFEAMSDAKEYMEIQDFNMSLLDRSTKIKAAIVNAINSNSIELVFSPIYQVKSKKINHAIIDFRFIDEEIGYVYSSEMVPVLEKQGILLDVIKRVNAMIVEFVKSDDFKKMGVYSLILRVSSSVTIQAGYMDEIFDLFLENDIDPSRIVIEINEAVVSNAKAKLRDVMEKRTKQGFKFVLCEYGSGYSNMSAIYDLPLSCLSVDGKVVRAAFEKKKARVALKKTLELSKKLNMQTSMAGIIDPKYFNMLQYFDCDYAYGSYFMENLKANDFADAVNSGKGVIANE